MASAKEKLNKIAEKEPSRWLEKAKDRKAKRSWSDKSARIALRVLREIRRQKPINGMSQKALARKMKVSPQYINKVVNGEENLSLETISKLEEALGITLMEIPREKKKELYVDVDIANGTYVKSTGVKKSKKRKFSYLQEENEYNTVSEPGENYATTG